MPGNKLAGYAHALSIVRTLTNETKAPLWGSYLQALKPPWRLPPATSLASQRPAQIGSGASVFKAPEDFSASNFSNSEADLKSSPPMPTVLCCYMLFNFDISPLAAPRRDSPVVTVKSPCNRRILQEIFLCTCYPWAVNHGISSQSPEVPTSRPVNP